MRLELTVEDGDSADGAIRANGATIRALAEAAAMAAMPFYNTFRAGTGNYHLMMGDIEHAIRVTMRAVLEGAPSSHSNVGAVQVISRIEDARLTVEIVLKLAMAHAV